LYFYKTTASTSKTVKREREIYLFSNIYHMGTQSSGTKWLWTFKFKLVLKAKLIDRLFVLYFWFK